MIYFSHLSGARGLSIGTAALCLLTVVNSAIYFDGRSTPFFLLEKRPWSQQPWWLTTFYFHVVAASICLLSGLPLLIPSWIRHYPLWHRRLGYVYFNSVLWAAAPTGLVMSATAKGGLCGASGFVVLAVPWWFTTWMGYRAIRRGEIAHHARWMIRSYALALSAPAFRLLYVLVSACGIADDVNYLVSLWLSIGVSVGLSESCIHRLSLDRNIVDSKPVPSLNTGVRT